MRTPAYAALLRRGFRYDIGDSDCIHINGKSGYYGYMQVRWGNGTSQKVHRISYEEWHGPIPQGFHVDHICHNKAAAQGLCAGGRTCLHRSCVNPMHLEAKSHQDNMLASVLTAPGRGPVGHSLDQTLKTHCPRDHEYTEENTYIWHRPGTTYIARMCRTCLRDRQRTMRAKRISAGLNSTGEPRKYRLRSDYLGDELE